ncbi:hypothetical protein N0B31_01715 [Salinirubellus salinus]|jgi:hypothetical protein|uniref:Uncharacterized protein n=1 Tax=Salinirubellus salinus TaxID=1364945 RepID=A0A9E7UBS8_9EURY|nr:hypothetical protein [Salinirubellus salinus]UWM55009.1 hypothetical protein N0B31_01715 [Salinirubellus salinus]
METLGELVGTVAQFDGSLPRVEVTSHAERRRVEHLDRLLRRAEADGTLNTMFTPGYPPVRVQVAADDDTAVVVVDDTDAEASLGEERQVEVHTHGRTRRVSLPFVPTSLDQRTIAGRTVVSLD